MNNYIEGEVKYKYSKLYHNNFVEVFSKIYKCGCGVMFECRREEVFCGACRDREALVNALESLSEFATKTGQSEALRDTFCILSEAIDPDSDLACEDEFPQYNKVMRELYPHYFE